MSGELAPSILVNGPTPRGASVKWSGARDESGGWARIELGWLRTAPAANPIKSRRFKPDTEPTIADRRDPCKGLHALNARAHHATSSLRFAAVSERPMFEDWRSSYKGPSAERHTCAEVDLGRTTMPYAEGFAASLFSTMTCKYAGNPHLNVSVHPNAESPAACLPRICRESHA
jgi:hypothetical protein